MGSLKTYALAGLVAAVASSTALAADLLPPPPPMMAPPPAIEVGGGWYLRGDIGMSQQKVGKLEDSLVGIEVLQTEFDSAPFVGIGAGYQFNSWLRVDGTAEYRGKSNFHSFDRWATGDPNYPGGYGMNLIRATKSETVLLANGYVDLGTWYGVTPFIGAGVGTANVKIGNYVDQNLGSLDGSFAAFAGEGSKWNLAWALYAGLGYQVTPNLTLEMGYRYLNMGDGQTGTVRLFNGACTRCEVLKFKEIESHDVKFGFRWMMAQPAMVAEHTPMHAPIITKY